MIDDTMNDTGRRRFLSGVALGAAAAATGLAAPALAQSQPAGGGDSKTFVFVHGGWRGGWCWRPTTDILESMGHKCFTPTLTGLGERSHLLNKDITLDTHTTDIVNVFHWEQLENVVLVGHSVGGLTLTPVAQAIRDKISSIVFLDAFVPEVGESANNTASEASREAQKQALAKGEISTPPFPAKAFGGGNEEIWAWIDKLSTPHPLLPLMTECAAIDGRESIAKKTFIRALGFPSATFDRYYAKTKADASWTTFEIDSGHDVMILHPQELVDMLLQVA